MPALVDKLEFQVAGTQRHRLRDALGDDAALQPLAAPANRRAVVRVVTLRLHHSCGGRAVHNHSTGISQMPPSVSTPSTSKRITLICGRDPAQKLSYFNSTHWLSAAAAHASPIQEKMEAWTEAPPQIHPPLCRAFARRLLLRGIEPGLHRCLSSQARLLLRLGMQALPV